MRICVLIGVVCTSFMVHSCSPTDKKAALQMSRQITTINDTVSYLGKVWGENVGQAVVTKNYTLPSGARAKQINYIDYALRTVGGMQDIGGSDDLRNTELEFLKFEKQMFTNVATIEHFNVNTSDEEVLKTLNDLKIVSKRETNMLNNVQVMQQAYAARNELPADSLKKR
jgi:hypothetical protein